MKLHLPIPTKLPLACLILALLLSTALPCRATIYKYQKDGVWYYTDTPPEDMPSNREEIMDNGRRTPAPTGRGNPVLAAFPAKNDIERAVAATVAVQSPVGFGSGFFISADGYLVTNKHVIRGSQPENEKNEAYFTSVENQIEAMEKRLANEKARIQKYHEQLENYKNAARAESNPGMKQTYLENYETKKKELEAWETDFKKRRGKFEAEKKRFRSDRASYAYSRTVAGLSKSFTIFLADNTKLYARLVAVSQSRDLALLKLDGYQVPSLKPGQAARLAQSDPVYAIGNPVKLKNSVTSGVFSGFEQGFLQTNAQIYPGNSGGPLVNAKGEVLGVNTFKKLTHKFEGLGFAIPIQVVLGEFSPYLNTQ